MKNENLLKQTERLQEILVGIATGKMSYQDNDIVREFNNCRISLLSNNSLRKLLPDIVKNYRDLSSFWSFIKNSSSTYEGRRLLIADEFRPLFNYFEAPTKDFPSDQTVMDSFVYSNEYLIDLWKKCLERRENDPEGAITVSRTFLEGTCKYILDALDVEYGDSDKLPQLFSKTTKALELAPSDHTDQQFKQIISGGFSIVNGLSSLRNEISDSHAITAGCGRPSYIHSTLCVNVAGVISEFLLSTFDAFDIPF